jgi:hypothetical protein
MAKALKALTALARCTFYDALTLSRLVGSTRHTSGNDLGLSHLGFQDPVKDASPSGGFRAVVLKLRFVDELAQSLAVAGHVCELILMLRPIAERVVRQPRLSSPAVDDACILRVPG